MENTFDSSAVPNLNFVVEEIFSSCSEKTEDVVRANILIEFVKPYMSDHLSGLNHLKYTLDPNNEDPLVNRKSFYEAMRSWITKMKESDSKLLNISFKDTDVYIEKESLPFHRSTPRPSLEPDRMKNSNDFLDSSNLSPTSFIANTKDNSIGMDKLLFVEERYQELEHKHMNTVKELSLLRSQLTISEEQYAELKQDLDRTNKRLILEQQVNADLQKSMVYNDDFKEEVCNTKKEKDHLHRMWLLTKRENVNLVAQVKDLEYEKERFEKQMAEMQRKNEQKRKEFYDLHALFTIYEDENKLLKKSKIELEEKLLETKASLDHYTEVSQILKNKIQALTAACKRKGIEPNYSNLENDPSNLSNSSGIPVDSVIQSQISSSTPLKDLQRSWRRDFDLFTSPKLQHQLASPITPSGLDTPLFLKTKHFSNKHVIINSQPCTNSPLDRVQINHKGVQRHNKRSATGSVKFDRSKNLPSVGSSRESLHIEENDSFSQKIETSLQSENSEYDIIEDLDLSSVSDNLRSFNGQDLLSELQECKFLDNHNKCYIEEHADIMKIVKEHENCSQIIADKQKEIESISEEFDNFLIKSTYIKDEVEFLEEQLKSAKSENEKLNSLNSQITSKIAELKAELQAKNIELKKIVILDAENSRLVDELNNKSKQNDTQHNEIIIEKENLQTSLKELEKKYHDLFKEKNHLYTVNCVMNEIIETDKKELNDMQNLKIKNKEFEKDIMLMKFSLDQSGDEVNKLSEKLLSCRENGKFLVQKINSKIKEQNSKLELQRDFSRRLQEYVNELQSSIEINKQRLNLLITDNSVDVKNVLKCDDEDRTATSSSESFTHHRSKRDLTKGKRSNFEKQQFKINKLEEKIEELEKDLLNEKLINDKLRKIEYEMNSIEMEKVNLQQEKKSILRELEAVKYDLSIKDEMMKQYEEKHKFDLENLSHLHAKEMNLTEVAQMAVHKEIEIRECSLLEQINELEGKLNELKQEKMLFENKLKEKDDKIVVLEKALSDISTATEKTKSFGVLVTEKDSMLKFNRELLLKSNNSLKQAENRCISLEVLVDKCKMVLSETVKDVLRSTIEVFNFYNLERRRVDPQLLHQLEILTIENSVEDFTPNEILLAHNHLTLTSNLLKALVNSCKSVGKLVSQSSKPPILRLSSSNSDICFSSTKKLKNRALIEETVIKTEEMQGAEKTDPINALEKHASETDWQGPYKDDLRVEMRNRKVTEKKFSILSSTWHTNFAGTKKKYRTLKLCCNKTKDVYLQVLLQIVTYIKNHRCHQDQRTLIHALKLVEKMKDLLFAVFKQAEQYGACKQELHLMKCWYLIMENVNTLHKEIGLLRLYRCTSTQLTDDPKTPVEIVTDTTDLGKTFRSIGVGDSFVNEPTFSLPSVPVKSKRKKWSSFIMMMFTSICLVTIFIIFIHIECIRNGNDTIICPLDMLVSIKKTTTG